MNTEQQYEDVVENCRSTFLKKTKDYGTSWRVYRPISVADQIYIKAKRIRTIQEKKDQKIGDDIKSEFEGMLNYSVIGLIQLDINSDDPEDLDPALVRQLYDQKIKEAKELMQAKNHDYGEAWREMSMESFADLSLAKILRIKQIIANGGVTIASEGIGANFFDILNYSAFALIQISEQKNNQMKISVTIARILTGALFIFSGLVKAIDPKGLAYKMQEFFEAWSNSGFMPGLMKRFDSYALSFSMIMITLEVLVGVALLIGWKKRLTTWILLLLMLFFTFLTSYVLFTGKIRACGCFGDCIPLTPIQTFTKDIILLLLSLFLLFSTKYIHPIAKPLFSLLYMIAALIMVLVIQFYALKHLPLKDCLPYKKGNNILELRKMPANAVMDKFEYTFIYEKGGEKRETKGDAPDSTWTFADRKQVLVEKGSNNIPVINDFSLTAESGTDSTEALLSTPGEYYLLYIKDLEDYPLKKNEDADLIKKLTGENKKIFIVTAQPSKIKERFAALNPVILSCDATVLKTVARVNPTLYLMNGPVVKDKWSWADFDDVK